MKLFKKLMAGAMAIAMLSAYVVAFAGSNNDTPTNSGSGKVEIEGHFGGDEVFLMKIPTAAANGAFAFTVDPNEAIHNSPPSNAITTGSGISTYGTVVFSIESGSSGQYTYTNTSKPLQVISMSSTDVTVNMIATLSDTKMTLSTTSGFDAASGDAKKHLYLGVQVATLSGGTPTPVSAASGGLQAVCELGAMQATTLKTVARNFQSIVTGGVNNTVVSGYDANTDNAAAAAAIPDSQWTGVQYTVIGASNKDADWEIEGLAAPNLTIKWVVDAHSTKLGAIYENGTNGEIKGSNYTAKFDKAKYRATQTATLYVLPKNEEEKLSAVTLTYIALKDGKMSEEKSFSVLRDGISTTAINGVYKATFAWPTDMAKDGSPAGDVTTYKAPTWVIEVG